MNTCDACGQTTTEGRSICPFCFGLYQFCKCVEKNLNQNPVIVLAECPHLFVPTGLGGNLQSKIARCGCNRAIKDGSILKCYGCGAEWTISSTERTPDDRPS